MLKINWFALTAALFAFCFSAAAQQPRFPRIGYSSTSDPSSPGPLVEAFRQGLRDLGYIEGKNILVEYRYAEGKVEGIESSVTELVRLRVDVLVVTTLVGILAARRATQSIPVVMIASEDPVALGIVHSLARPGGNITGFARLQRELSGKRLELLLEAVKGISRAGVLWDSDSRTASVGLKEYESAARPLKIELQSLPVRGANLDLEDALQTAVRKQAEALITITTTPLFRQQRRIAELALKNRLPSMFEGSTWVEAGGLMCYSTKDSEVFRRAAVYVDKILKGAKPAELPIEQPKTFELVINLKTAKQLGLTIPPGVLARADRVIR
jgi:putative ABC transport system substrate-binding protein